MMNRLSVVVVAVSIAAYAIKQLTIRSWTSLILPTNSSENGEEAEKINISRQRRIFRGLDEQEQKANSINDATSEVNGRTYDIEVHHSLDELRELLPQESETRSFNDDKKEEQKVPEIQSENNAIELENLLTLVMELEERKMKLEGEMLMWNGVKHSETDVAALRKELDAKNEEISMLKITISSLQAERKKLQEEIVKGALMKKELKEARGKIKELQRQIQVDANQNQTKEHLLLLKRRVSGLQAKEEEAVKNEAELYKRMKAAKDFEVELEELKRKNHELRHKNKDLTSKLDVMKGRITALTSMTESEIVTREREEAQKLRSENEDLVKQLEVLQMNRFSEVEDLVYLRWINACLRYELRDKETSVGESARHLNKSLSPKSKEKAKQLMLEYAGLEFGQAAETNHQSNISHLFSSGIEEFDSTSIDSSRRRAISFSEKPNSNMSLKKLRRNNSVSNAVSSSRVIGSSQRWKDPLEALMALNAAEVRLQDSSKNSVNSVAKSFQLMSKSIEESLKQKYSAEGTSMRKKPATFPLKVKADMGTQGGLATEIGEASFSNIEDVVSFVIRLDEKLSSLVDGMEILEQFDWPERKIDALREAAFGYQKLKKLEEEVSSFVDNPKLTCEVALNKMCSLLDKVEQSVNRVLSTRDMAISQYEELGIPIDWLLDSGVVGKMKVSCVALARKYMKRIVNEHNALTGLEEEPNRELLLLQGVRFASRVHKFAGGFDSESMKAFEELRSRVHTEAGKNNFEHHIRNWGLNF